MNLQSCTILDNLYGKYPLLTIDLGHKMKVSGVVIYTWQGDGQGEDGLSNLGLSCSSSGGGGGGGGGGTVSQLSTMGVAWWICNCTLTDAFHEMRGLNV